MRTQISLLMPHRLKMLPQSPHECWNRSSTHFLPAFCCQRRGHAIARKMWYIRDTHLVSLSTYPSRDKQTPPRSGRFFFREWVPLTLWYTCILFRALKKRPQISRERLHFFLEYCIILVLGKSQVGVTYLPLSSYYLVGIFYLVLVLYHTFDEKAKEHPQSQVLFF